MDYTESLEVAKYLIQNAIDALNEAPEKIAIATLLQMLYEIDDQYQEWCADMDDTDDLPEGTTYDDGPGPIEYYIESLNMHELSLQIRKIRELK